MLSREKSGLLFSRRYRLVIAVLAIVLAGFATTAAAWHIDVPHPNTSHSESPDRDCPICQVANLPLVKPMVVAQILPPTVVERHVPPAVSLQELEAALTFSSPRAPPA